MSLVRGTLITALMRYSEYIAQRFVHLVNILISMRIEFQQRGSPHVHSLLWIENAPKNGISALNEVHVHYLISIVYYLMVKLIYNVINTLIHVIRENHSEVVDMVFLTHLWFKLKFQNHWISMGIPLERKNCSKQVSQGDCYRNIHIGR